MDFNVQAYFMTGVMLGIEFITDEENESNHLVISLFIICIMFSFYKDEE